MSMQRSSGPLTPSEVKEFEELFDTFFERVTQPIRLVYNARVKFLFGTVPEGHYKPFRIKDRRAD